MPKLNQTMILTAVGVAIGGVVYAKFFKGAVNSTLGKVA